MTKDKDKYQIKTGTVDSQWRKMQIMNITALEHEKEKARSQTDLDSKRVNMTASTSALIGALSILL